MTAGDAVDGWAAVPGAGSLGGLVGALHDRMWRRGIDGIDRRTAVVLLATGAPGGHLVRARRWGGWLAPAAVAVLLWAWVASLVRTARFVDGGTVDLLGGSGLVLVGAVLLALDAFLRMSGAPVLAVGPRGVAIADSPDPRTPVGRVARRPVVPAVSLVPWGDVDAVVHLRPRDGVGPAELGVRLRRPLARPWPYTERLVAPSEELLRLGLGTRLLTRPVDPLGPRDLALLEAAVGAAHPGVRVVDERVGATTRPDPAAAWSTGPDLSSPARPGESADGRRRRVERQDRWVAQRVGSPVAYLRRPGEKRRTCPWSFLPFLVAAGIIGWTATRLGVGTDELRAWFGAVLRQPVFLLFPLAVVAILVLPRLLPAPVPRVALGPRGVLLAERDGTGEVVPWEEVAAVLLVDLPPGRNHGRDRIGVRLRSGEVRVQEVGTLGASDREQVTAAVARLAPRVPVETLDGRASLQDALRMLREI